MVQPILLNRTDTDDTDPPLLNYGELAVATGPTYTKMWLGDGTENRLLVSDDPADGPIFGGGGGGGAYLPLTGGDLTGALTISVPAATPALTVAGRGVIYSQLSPTNSFSFFANGAVIIPFVNGVAGSGFINVSGGNMTGALALSGDPINPMQAATKQYVDTMLPLTGGNLSGPLGLASVPPTGTNAALPGTLFAGQEISFPGVSNNFDIVWNAYQNSAGNWVATAAGGPAMRLSGDVNGTLRISNALGPAGAAGEAVNWQDTAWFSRTTNSRINSTLNVQAPNNTNTGITATSVGGGFFPYLSLQNNGSTITGGMWSDATPGGNLNIGQISPAGAITGTPWMAFVPGTGLATVRADPTAALGIATKQYVDTAVGSARYIPQLDPSNDVAVTAAGAAPILSGYETPVSAGDDWFMIRTMRDVDGTAIIMRGPTFPDPNAADGTEFWVGAGGNFLFWMQPTGQFILPADPTDPMAAVTKQYADALGGGGASVEVGDNPPASPATGDLWFDTVGSQLYIFDTDQDQWIITTNTPGGGGGGGPVDLTGSSLQLAFFFPGVPTSATTVIIPIAVAITIPANLAGSVTYLGDTPAANTGNFILYHSSGSGSQGIGTISFNTNGVPTFGGTGGTIPAGDALLMDSPSTPDTQLSNIGITILATRA